MIRREQPLFVTFDTNTYSNIANPQPRKLLEKWWPLSRDRWRSKKLRVAWLYLARCIRKGRIVGGIPEALIATEALQNVRRVALLLAVGTQVSRPAVPPGRLELIRKAIAMGFRVMKMPRIGHPPMYQVAPEEWAAEVRYSQGDRINRSHAFGRHFNDYAHQAMRDFGEKLAQAHGLTSAAAIFVSQHSGETPERYLWREGFAAEEAAPKLHASVGECHKALRKLFADWTDFDVAAAHYGYGYDLLCTEDLGKQSSNSIFGPQHATGSLGIDVITVMELARLSWRRFGLPLRRWG